MPRFSAALACAAALAVVLGATVRVSGPGAARAQDAPGGGPKPPVPAPTATGEEEDAQFVLDAGNAAEAILDKIINQNVVPVRVDPEDPLLKKRAILVTGEINRITAHEVVTKILLLAESSLPIDLYLRTNGGIVDDSYAILDAMRVIRAPVNVWALGACDSAGAVILAGATGRRRVLAHGEVMLHFTEEAGDAPYSEARVLRTREEAFWRRVAKLPEEWFPLVGEREYFLLPEDAVRLGVADEIFQLPK